MSNNFKKINPTQNKIKTTRDVKKKNLNLNTNYLRYSTYDADDEDDNYIKSCNTYGNTFLTSKKIIIPYYLIQKMKMIIKHYLILKVIKIFLILIMG